MLKPWFDIDVVESGTRPPIDDLPAAVRRAMQEPRRSPSRARRLLRNFWHLGDLASDANNIRHGAATAVVVVTDLTRACPDDVLVPPILDDLNADGISDERITVVIPDGLHLATTVAEKRQ